MKVIPTALFAMALCFVIPALANAPNPVKLTAAEAKGPIFDRKDAVKENGAEGATTDVTLMQSADKKMSVGVYKAGASDISIASYPEDEFCFFLSGSVKLTSSDGTVLEVNAGEAVAIHKGWKGRWTSSGYTKYYVTYETK